MERYHVLIIEDDETLTDALVDVLGSAGYTVTSTSVALGATSLVRRLRPDVILLDLGLPYRSGASLLVELKADPHTASIPVVVASGSPEALSAGRRALATAVIGKPFELQALLDTVGAAIASAKPPACAKRGRVTADIGPAGKASG